MNHAILFDPSYSMLEIELAPNEFIQAEAGAMVSRSNNIDMTTKMNAGTAIGFGQKLKALFVAVIKKLLGGESFFINEFRASNDQGAQVTLSPVLPGCIIHHRLENATIILQGGAYLANTGNLNIRVKFAGLKALFSGHGLFFLEVSGTGDLFFNAFGGIYKKEITEPFTLDTGHLVAYEPSLDYKIARAGNLKSTLFSGEGLVMNFSGKGNLYFQSRNIGAMVAFVNPKLPE